MSVKKETIVPPGSVLLVTKCLAIEVTTCDDEHDVTTSENTKRTGAKTKQKTFDAVNIFMSIQRFNVRCYWNPGLLEGVKNLQFVGYLAPRTILVTGQSDHIEVVKAAWTRRLFQAPAGLTIQRIGEVGDIEMQPISQTQFIPLPDALCIVISDLASAQEPSTLDGIRNKLKGSYKEMCTPPDQIIYETLEQLVRERKVLHTANGYFIVSPNSCASMHQPGFTDNTMRCLSPQFCRSPDQQPMGCPEHQFCGMSPVFFPVTPPKVKVTSRSCQTHGRQKIEGKDKHKEKENKHPPRKLERSQSFEKDYTNRVSKKLEAEGKHDSFKRSASMRYTTQEKSDAAMRDLNSQHSNIHQEKDKGEKSWLLSKLFGKGKKTKSSGEDCGKDEEKSKVVKHATFSAQFPPPEWEWYNKEHITLNRIQKSSTWHHLQSPPHAGIITTQHNGDDCGNNNVRNKMSTLTPENGQGSVPERRGKSKRHEKRQKASTLPARIEGVSRQKEVARSRGPIRSTPIKKDKEKTKRKSCVEKKDSVRKNLEEKLNPKTQSNISRSQSAPSGSKQKNKLLGPKEQEVLLPVVDSETFSELEKSDIYNPYSTKNSNWAERDNGTNLVFDKQMATVSGGHDMLLDCVDDLTSLDEDLYEKHCRTSSSDDTLPSVVKNHDFKFPSSHHPPEYLKQTSSDKEVSEILGVGHLSTKHSAKPTNCLDRVSKRASSKTSSSNNENADDGFYSQEPSVSNNGNLRKQNDLISKSRDCGVNCVGIEPSDPQVAYSPKHHESRFSSKSNKARNLLDAMTKDKNQNVASKIHVQNNLGDSGFNSPLTNRTKMCNSVAIEHGKSPGNLEEKVQNNVITGSQLSLEGITLRSSEYYPSTTNLKIIKETDLDEDLYLNDTGPKGSFGQDYEVVGVL